MKWNQLIKRFGSTTSTPAPSKPIGTQEALSYQERTTGTLIHPSLKQVMLNQRMAMQSAPNAHRLNGVMVAGLLCSVLSLSQLCLAQPVVAATVTEELTTLTDKFNTQLNDKISELNVALPDISIDLMDVNTLFADTLPNELTETALSCIQGPPLAPAAAPTSICPNPEDHLYFDEIHPPTTVHQRIADVAVESLRPGALERATQLFVFGDSLSDSTNVYGFSGGTFPFPVAVNGPLAGTPLYANGNFTNGRIWWSYLSEAADLKEPIAYYKGAASGDSPTSIPNEGLNFAVGGATTGTDNAGNTQNPPFPIELPGLQDQVAAFNKLIQEKESADPDALYIVWAGPNNILGSYLPEDPENPFGPFEDFTTDTTIAVDDIGTAIENLYQQGARKFLVGNMYDLGKTPLGKDLETISDLTFEPSLNLVDRVVYSYETFRVY